MGFKHVKGVFWGVHDRQIGDEAHWWQRDLVKRRFAELKLSPNKFLKSFARAGVAWLDLDTAEQRYLLASTTTACIGLYDTQARPKSDELPAVSVVTRQSPGGHQFMVSCVEWYPIDTGMFVSGSYDQHVKVWDTNRMEAVMAFNCSSKVTQVSLSKLATTHCLIAASCHEQAVRLCDPQSGAVTASLTGHRHPVWTVAWSLRSEFELMSGDSNGQVRTWDIRRAGCVEILDQHRTQPPRRSQRGGTGASATPAWEAWSGRPAPAQERASPHTPESYALAHDGGVTALVPTPDGLHWLTAGNDSRLRLWDATHYTHMQVHYDSTNNRAMRARQVCVAAGGDVVLHPSGSIVQVLEVGTGALLNELQQGHYESINACVYSPVTEEVFTGANDGQILVWAMPPNPSADGGPADRWDD